MLMVYTLLTHLDDARVTSSGCTHHLLEHRMRSNWKVIEHLLAKSIANGWAVLDPGTRTYSITEEGRSFRALLEKAIAPIYVDYLDRKS